MASALQAVISLGSEAGRLGSGCLRMGLWRVSACLWVACGTFLLCSYVAGAERCRLSWDPHRGAHATTRAPPLDLITSLHVLSP